MSRRRSVWCLVALLLVLGWPCLVLCLADPAARAVALKLDVRFTLLGARDGTTLSDTLRVVAEKADVKIVIDDDTFRAAGVENVGRAEVKCPKLVAVRGVTALRLLLGQVGASYRVRDGAVVVVPGAEVKITAPLLAPGRHLVEQARSRAQQRELLRQKLTQPLVLELGIDENTPLRDAVEFLSDRYDVDMAIDYGAFTRRGTANIWSATVSLPPLIGHSFASVLTQVLDQAGATFETHEDCLIVVPKPDPAREAPK